MNVRWGSVDIESSAFIGITASSQTPLNSGGDVFTT
jgi:hypothetical protein